MIAAGTTLQQRYRIDKQIGQGGMGAVYVATDERFGSTVAIKETLCMDDNFLKAIEREARLLNSLKHSALPRVSDHFLENDGQFLVMEYIQGEDLCCMLDGMGKAFDLDQVLKWADQLLDALDYLHNQAMPVIHRDIKPQNLKITAGGQIILLDFGLAKGNPTDAGQNTAAKSIFGYSRNYASLEQIQGTGTDPRSDLYSLAATLYHLMTNTPPEDALTRAMSVLSQKPDPLLPANVINPDIPAGVAGVLQKAMDLNADERPASAAEMRQMFRENEKYAYLAEPSTAATVIGEKNVFAQPTRLMSDNTRADRLMQTDLKTEVSSGFISEETSVAPGSPSDGRKVRVSVADSMPESAKGRSGLAVAVGALAVLLAGAVIAGGIYVLKPSVFGMEQQTENTGPALPAANTNPVSNANTESVQAASQAAAAGNAVPNAANEAAHSAEKPAETTKSGKASDKSKTTAADGTAPDEMINVTGDPDNPDQVTFTTRDKNGKVTTTIIRPPKDPDIPTPPVEGVDPFPKNFSLDNIPPAERRKILQKLRNRNLRPPANAPAQ